MILTTSRKYDVSQVCTACKYVDGIVRTCGGDGGHTFPETCEPTTGTANCRADTGWSCANDICVEVLRDGLLVGGEACDAGNTTAAMVVPAIVQRKKPVDLYWRAELLLCVSCGDSRAGLSTWVQVRLMKRAMMAPTNPRQWSAIRLYDLRPHHL